MWIKGSGATDWLPYWTEQRDVGDGSTSQVKKIIHRCLEKFDFQVSINKEECVTFHCTLTSHCCCNIFLCEIQHPQSHGINPCSCHDSLKFAMATPGQLPPAARFRKVDLNLAPQLNSPNLYVKRLLYSCAAACHHLQNESHGTGKNHSRSTRRTGLTR